MGKEGHYDGMQLMQNYDKAKTRPKWCYYQEVLNCEKCKIYDCVNK